MVWVRGLEWVLCVLVFMVVHRACAQHLGLQVALESCACLAWAVARMQGHEERGLESCMRRRLRLPSWLQGGARM